MKFIFDLDHTLFATEKFKAVSESYKASGEWVTPRIWEKFDASSFLYDDTISFLSVLDPKQVVILTAWTSSLGPESYEFQCTKVERCGVAKYASQVIVMEGDKGPYVKKLYENEPTVFVDDSIVHLLSVRQFCPEAFVVQMVREDVGVLPGDLSVPIAHTLKEINIVLKT